MSSNSLGRAYMTDYTTSTLYEAIAGNKTALAFVREAMAETYFEGPYEKEQDAGQRAESLQDTVKKIVAYTNPATLARSFTEASFDWIDWEKLAEMLTPSNGYPED